MVKIEWGRFKDSCEVKMGRRDLRNSFCHFVRTSIWLTASFSRCHDSDALKWSVEDELYIQLSKSILQPRSISGYDYNLSSGVIQNTWYSREIWCWLYCIIIPPLLSHKHIFFCFKCSSRFINVHRWQICRPELQRNVYKRCKRHFKFSTLSLVLISHSVIKL